MYNSACLKPRAPLSCLRPHATTDFLAATRVIALFVYGRLAFALLDLTVEKSGLHIASAPSPPMVEEELERIRRFVRLAHTRPLGSGSAYRLPLPLPGPLEPLGVPLRS